MAMQACHGPRCRRPSGLGLAQPISWPMVSHLPADTRPPASMVSQHIWAMSHGVVELFARNETGARSPFSPEDLLESGFGVYLRGLGLIPRD